MTERNRSYNIIPMGVRKRGVGRPAQITTVLAKWIAEHGWDRDRLASKLEISRSSLDRLCRGVRRPGLELAVRIEKFTNGGVPISSWLKVKRQSESS